MYKNNPAGQIIFSTIRQQIYLFNFHEKSILESALDMGEMEYQKMDLKRGVDYIGVTCVFVCHDGRGNILLHKRSQKCRDEQGRWDCGAGAMEFGETFEEAVTREIKEEYCVEPVKLRHVGATNVLRKNGDVDTHWIAVLFTVQVDPVKAAMGDPEKMDEIGWFHHTTLPSPLHSKFHHHFELVKNSGTEFM